MKLNRSDALGLEGFLHHLEGLGYRGAAVQLGSGVLQASIQTGGIGSVFGVRYTVDREFLFVGDRDSSFIPFAVMEPGSESWYHGAHSTGLDICGFQSNKSDTDCSWIGSMLVVYVPVEPFRQRLLAMGAPQALNQIENVNCLAPDPNAVQTFKRLFDQMIAGQLSTDDQILDFLSLQLLAAEPLEKPAAVRNWEQLTQGVRDLHSYSKAEPLTIAQWAQGMNMHETTLRSSCKERFNLSPSELHRLVRLTQAYVFLEDGTKKVDEAMQRFRFRNRGDFARYFREHFSINPSELCSDEPLILEPQQLDLFAA